MIWSNTQRIVDWAEAVCFVANRPALIHPLAEAARRCGYVPPNEFREKNGTYDKEKLQREADLLLVTTRDFDNMNRRVMAYKLSTYPPGEPFDDALLRVIEEEAIREGGVG